MTDEELGARIQEATQRFIDALKPEMERFQKAWAEAIAGLQRLVPEPEVVLGPWGPEEPGGDPFCVMSDDTVRSGDEAGEFAAYDTYQGVVPGIAKAISAHRAVADDGIVRLAEVRRERDAATARARKHSDRATELERVVGAVTAVMRVDSEPDIEPGQLHLRVSELRGRFDSARSRVEEWRESDEKQRELRKEAERERDEALAQVRRIKDGTYVLLCTPGAARDLCRKRAKREQGDDPVETMNLSHLGGLWKARFWTPGDDIASAFGATEDAAIQNLELATRALYETDG